ncbi:hypothetical protein IHE61_31030 [Streptomyces sp. GKU 257-1]|nr:hypothetical protein [Streptomyces sp. GKU 257-1]
MPTHPDPQKPDELGGPAAFARICGHKDTTTITRWVKNPPPGFPEPDQWEELETRRRPLWRLRRMQKFAANKPAARRGAGPPRQGPHRYYNDPRLTLARAALRDHPDASIPTLTHHIRQQWTGPTYSDPTWRDIIRTARQHPDDPDPETTP